MPIKTKLARVETGDTKVKVLLYDTENSPNESYTWGTYQQDVIKVKKHRQIFCFSWRWLHEKKVNCLALPDFPGYKKNPDSNKALVKELHKLMTEADVVIAHNVDGFDNKRCRTDFIKHGLSPVPHTKTVDTLKVARSVFGFNSNRLGDLGEFLGLGKKVRHSGFELWERCLNGDKSAWNLMKKYCTGDTILLHKIYMKLRPWMKTHPDMNALDNRDGCPVCKSRRMTRHKWKISGSGKHLQFQCQDCGKFSYGQFMPSRNKWRFK